MVFYEMFFSPTGGTKKVSGFLINEFNAEYKTIDLTDSKTDLNSIQLNADDIAIIAVPSYGGRVPVTAAERISCVHGNGTKAILACVYGNRAYEDTLVKLQDIVQDAGFSVIAAIAAIAEHSIARRYAANRPDEEDYRLLKDFAFRINGKLERGDLGTPLIPGNRPYKKASNAGIVPVATKDCVKCGICASKCPVAAIDKDNPAKVNKQVCISCMRCVSVCPHKARKVNKLLLVAVNMMLKKHVLSEKNVNCIFKFVWDKENDYTIEAYAILLIG